MFDFIRKPVIWKAWDDRLDRDLGATKTFELKSMQDLAVYSEIKDARGLDIAEVGSGHSRVLPTLSASNRCVAVDKFEGAGGGPKSKQALGDIPVISAYLGEGDSAIADEAYDIVFSVSVVEHVVTQQDLAAFHSDQLRILKPGGIFLHAIDMYLQDEPEPHHVKRFETYRDWVASTPGVEPIGPVYRGECRFSGDIATNPDNVMYKWGKSSPGLIGLRQEAQGVSLIAGGRKVADREG